MPLRVLEHGEIALHALAFVRTPALHDLVAQQMLDVVGGDRRCGVQMDEEVQERLLLGTRVLHNVRQSDVLDIRARHLAIPRLLLLVHEVHATGQAIAFVTRPRKKQESEKGRERERERAWPWTSCLFIEKFA